MARDWFSIKAAATEGRSLAAISIHDEIGGWGVSAKDFIADLKAVGEVDLIELSIHSPGGSVLDGWAIYNALTQHPAPVHVRIEGMAASMASVIAMAGDVIEIPENAFIMIHNPWSVAVGDADAMRSTADLLDKMGTGIVRAYEAKSGLGEDEIRDLMTAETWLTGEEAVEKGLATSLIGAVELAAVVDDQMIEALERQGYKTPADAQWAQIESDLEEAFAKAAGIEDLEESGDDDGELEIVVDLEPGVGEDFEEVADDDDEEAELVEASGSFVDRILSKFSKAGNGDLVAAQREAAEVSARLDDVLNQLEEARDLIAARETEIETLKGEQAEVEALVAERLAECGVPESEAGSLPTPAAQEESASAASMTPSQAAARLEELQAEDPAKAREFWKAHKRDIMRGTN